jgi:hypothetical protein
MVGGWMVGGWMVLGWMVGGWMVGKSKVTRQLSLHSLFNCASAIAADITLSSIRLVARTSIKSVAKPVMRYQFCPGHSLELLPSTV